MHVSDRTFTACNKLYRSTDTSDTSDDAFPEFYDICSDTSSTAKCDRSLNCLGLIEKSYVQSMVDLVRSNGSDNVFFEIMNRATFDKIDSRKEGYDLSKFKRWTDVVGYWIKCGSGNDCKNSRGDYLVLGEVGIAEFSDLACTNPSRCPNNPLDALAMPNVDMINLQGYTWDHSPAALGPCETAKVAIAKYKKPVIIDTDSAFERADKCNVEKWANEIRTCGNPGEVHLNHLDGMTLDNTNPKRCTFRGIGSPQLFEQFDGMYLDCHALDSIGDGDATFLSDIVTTSAPASCANSVGGDNHPTWCATTCKTK